MKVRYVIEVAYDGSNYHGWQKQSDDRTIQGEIEKALSIIFRENVEIMGSGRTDAGVHAEQQYAHFDLPASVKVDSHATLHSLRGIVPHDILVKSIKAVNPDFHARFDAKSRQYRYQIGLKNDVFTDRYTWIVRNNLNIELMQNAVALLTGELDFAAFSKFNPDVLNTRCKIDFCKLEIVSGERLFFYVKANRFLHHMVRQLAGTLVEIGRERISIEEFRDMFESPGHGRYTVSAPAHALFLEIVEY